MIREGEAIFVDTGAWIALALSKDALHVRARELWEGALSQGARVHTSIPVVLETFTFLERNTLRQVALAWNDSVSKLPRMKLLECTAHDLERSWHYFKRKDLHKLSAVDATSFTLMARHKVRVAFAFDHHFATAGFRMLG